MVPGEVSMWFMGRSVVLGGGCHGGFFEVSVCPGVSVVLGRCVCGSRGGIFMVPGEVSHWFLVRYHCSF